HYVGSANLRSQTNLSSRPERSAVERSAVSFRGSIGSHLAAPPPHRGSNRGSLLLQLFRFLLPANGGGAYIQPAHCLLQHQLTWRCRLLHEGVQRVARLIGHV